MNKIQVLDQITIDKIAAGEVVERPVNVVKELIENAIDAKAGAITIEIKEGGIGFLRITDNGHGIEESQVRKAFLRHATSKIRKVEDLYEIYSLGFRGEALSSISAVAQVEMMTKTKDSLLGTHYRIEGGREISMEQVGLPEGTTIIVKNLFYNTPARSKFLKSKVTEGGYIADLCEHMAMSKPEISFRFISNGQLKFHTSGNGQLSEIIYRIFGRDFVKELIPISVEKKGLQIHGFLGKPTLNRSNRNYENCFVNGRYVKSSYLYKAVEEGYRPYLMQHKFPFVVLYFTLDPGMVDINVHPTKMDIRLTNSQEYYQIISEAIQNCLREWELIPDMDNEIEPSKKQNEKKEEKKNSPEPFEQVRRKETLSSYPNALQQLSFLREAVFSYENKNQLPEKKENRDAVELQTIIQEKRVTQKEESLEKKENVESQGPEAKLAVPDPNFLGEQLNLFEEKILSKEHKQRFTILGQVFNTYWLISYEEKLLFVDQHSAHEKVKFEKLMKEYKQGSICSQLLQPAMILSLTQREESLLKEYQSYFKDLGFVWEDFGDHSIALREVPMDLYGKGEKELFLEILDELWEENITGTPEVIREKIISMACKSAVKGNQSMTKEGMEALLEQLFTLDNPYHCPHGRPTIISMTKNQLEKKFKRIV